MEYLPCLAPGHCSQQRRLLAVFIVLLYFIFRNNVPRTLSSPPSMFFGTVCLSCVPAQTSQSEQGAPCVGASPPVSLVPCAASSCSARSPWPVLGQALGCGVLLQAPEHVQGGAQLPGQPLTFLPRNWMSPLLSSCAIVVCVVGMGSQHPAASKSGAPSISPGLVFWWVLASSAVELPGSWVCKSGSGGWGWF